MDLIYACCAGLDVHKKTVVACVRRLGQDGRVDSQVRTYRTMTADLIALADWLDAEGVSHVAMESTGVYWKPVFHLLEGRFEVLLVNAHRIKNVPGRKTDVKDAEWIAQLLQHGLLEASFIPPPPIRELRDLTRGRTQLVRERATVVRRIHKVLEDANIKLASVATDVLGVSGREMLEALIGGQEDPAELAGLARGKLRAKTPELRLALRGLVTEHHRFQLGMLLRQVDQLEGLIAEYTARIEAVAAPVAEAAARLETIPGLGGRAAEVIVAEIGTDMAKFPTAGHLASWAGLCPGNNESAGKRRSGKTTEGSQWLRTTLVQVAWSASHAKETIFQATYRRWAKRLGKKKALVALGHKILTVIYKLLKDGIEYRELWTAPQGA
ncbi:MAG: IS110 family transposase [Planctomycetia bacterium]|nr:IS110 family transposase [Planctomycetia bacterium]